MAFNKIHIDQCTAVSITRSADDGLLINVCTVQRRNDKLDIDQSAPVCSSLAELFKSLPAKSVISLNLNGKGILHKQQRLDETIGQGGFEKILPGANESDFYIQRFISGESSFTSVVRKADADKWISDFKNAGFTVIMLSLGPFPVQLILKQLNIYGNELVFYGHDIKYNEDGLWTAYTYHEQAVATYPLKADLEPILERLVLPYAVAFQAVLSDKLTPVTADVPELRLQFTKLIKTRKIKVISFCIIAVFFILLAVNMVVFSTLYTENGQLAAQLGRYSRDNEGVKKLEETVQQNEALLKELGWDGGINKSAMIDQIAGLLPWGLTWKEVAVNPVDLQQSREQKSVRFTERRISITGNAAAVTDVNEWIARMRSLKSVKNARLESYTFNNELNTGQFKIWLDY
jgi:Tfp pilus assembly protein PilN